MAVGDEIVELGQWDAVRIAPGRVRSMEAGPTGPRFSPFGAPNTENKDAEIKPGWWPEDVGQRGPWRTPGPGMA